VRYGIRREAKHQFKEKDQKEGGIVL